MAVTAGLSLLILMALPVAAQIQTVYFHMFGGTLTLNPKYPEFINNITWKYKEVPIIKYSTDYSYRDLEYSGIFKYRAWMSWTSGTLIIKDMRRSEGGLFTVEINGDPPITFNAVGLNKLAGYPVEVFVRPQGCSSSTSKNCTLVCGEPFPGAEPVQYFWKTGKTGEWKNGNKTLSISFTNNTTELSDYTCKVKNPISEKHSDKESDEESEIDPEEKQNPLQSSSGPVPLPAILLLVVLAVGAAVVVQLIKKPPFVQNLFGLRREK